MVKGGCDLGDMIFTLLLLCGWIGDGVIVRGFDHTVSGLRVMLQCQSELLQSLHLERKAGAK